MNRHLLTFLVALTFLIPTTQAQTSDKKFGVEVYGGIREYHGDLGSALYFQRRPDYQFVGASFGMYLNPSFDANFYGSAGDLGFYNENVYDVRTTGVYRQGFRSHITNVMLGVTYKFNNGYIMAEDAKFKPFVRGGWGVSQSITRLSHNKVGYSQSRNWLASHWNAGLGFKYALSPSLDLTFSETFNYSFDDNYDGEPFTLAGAKLNDAMEGNKPLHDAFVAHAIGFAYNFGGVATSSNSGYRFKDSDNDGVGDDEDMCPNTPADVEVDSVGCPIFDKKLSDEVSMAAAGIYFETGKDVIKAESFENLDKLVTILTNNANLKATIEGHTDDQGEAKANMKLSQSRADAVKRYLENKGIAGNRLSAKGFGETQPIADNSTEEGRALNRRVDFKLAY